MRASLPPGLARGIKLHRAIDAYTDSHPIIQQLRRDLPQNLRRYAGILVDLCFDHYLSEHWSRFSDISLTDFNDEVYRILLAQQDTLSPGAQQMVTRLIEHNILFLYRDWETVPAAAARIGQRFKRTNPFQHIDRELSPSKKHLEQAFLKFYPQLQDFSSQQSVLLK